MAPNAVYEEQSPTFYHGKSMHVISPLTANSINMTGYDNVLPPLVITDATCGEKHPQQEEKENEEEGEEDLFLSPKGRSSHSRDTSKKSTSRSRDSSKKTRDTSRKSRDSSRKSRDTSRKSTRSKRKPIKRSTTESTPPFDPTRVPLKSSMKKANSAPSFESSSSSNPASSASEQRRRKRGGIFRVYLPGVRGPIKRERSIRFDNHASVRKVRSARSLANNDPSVLWWQEDEHASIKANLQRLLNRVNRWGISKTNGKKYCTRGLERFLDPEESSELEQLRAEEAVFREQVHQRDCGAFDASRIAAVYSKATRISQQRATRMGNDDAMIAKSILQGDSFRSSGYNNNINSGGPTDAPVGDESSQLQATLQSPLPLPSPSRSLQRASSFRRDPEQQKPRQPRRTKSYPPNSPVPSMASMDRTNE